MVKAATKCHSTKKELVKILLGPPPPSSPDGSLCLWPFIKVKMTMKGKYFESTCNTEAITTVQLTTLKKGFPEELQKMARRMGEEFEMRGINGSVFLLSESFNLNIHCSFKSHLVYVTAWTILSLSYCPSKLLLEHTKNTSMFMVFTLLCPFLGVILIFAPIIWETLLDQCLCLNHLYVQLFNLDRDRNFGPFDK